MGYSHIPVKGGETQPPARSPARTDGGGAKPLGKLTKYADTFREDVDAQTAEIKRFSLVKGKRGGCNFTREAYDADNADLERWLLKSKARQLLFVLEERQKRTRVPYSALVPYSDLATRKQKLAFDAESFKIYDAADKTVFKDGKAVKVKTTKKAAVYRVVNCTRDRISAKLQPEIWQSRKTERASFHNLLSCGSVWTCPTCSRRINLGRRQEIATAYNAFVNSAEPMTEKNTAVRNADALMITFTIKHGIGDKLSELFEALKTADRGHLQKSYAYKKIVGYSRTVNKVKVKVASPYAFIGRISTSEITHGSNGWHPHMHQLWFFDRRLSDREIATIRDDLFKSWAAACVAAGLPEPAYRVRVGSSWKYVGVDVRRALSAEEYMSKFGTERTWGPEAEMASQHTKSGRKGRTAFQLLYDAMQGDEKAGDLFKVFASGTLGKHQIEFSTGLRKRLADLGHADLLDRTDDELAATLEDDSRKLGTLTNEDFMALCDSEKHGIEGFGTMLVMCKMSGFDAAIKWLRSLPCHGDVLRPSEAQTGLFPPPSPS